VFIAEMQPLISMHTTHRETVCDSFAAWQVELPFGLSMVVLRKVSADTARASTFRGAENIQHSEIYAQTIIYSNTSYVGWALSENRTPAAGDFPCIVVLRN
jgi:hypothetical protein